MTQITTPALLRAERGRTGFLEPVLVGIVAKSALIRHVATTGSGKDFVLKGGTLLHHVYASPRFSIKDADFTYRDPDHLNEPQLNATLTLRDPDFSVDFTNVEWNKAQAIWSANVGYSIGGAALPPGRTGLTVTVSIRLGEWLDPQPQVMYSDPMLDGVSQFLVNGLTREELAAEKILAWCTKLLAKHAVDLACLARDHPSMDFAKVRKLTELKFDRESHMPRYKNNGIQRFRDLATAIASPQAFQRLGVQWRIEDLLIPTAERIHPKTLRLQQNVEEFIRTVWVPVLV